MEFFKSFLSALSATGANILIYIVIVLVFLMGLALCVGPVLNTRAHLRSAVTALKKKSNKKSWQEETFLGKGALMASWCEYLKNLRFSDGVYHAATSVEDYINEDTVIYGPGRTSFAEALPGIMTSLGFLGTLIGLSRGLSGFDMADAAAAQQSIRVLIPNMKYAFATSIFGVVGSVLFTMILRSVYGSAERTVRYFCAALEQSTGVHSVDPLTQLATYQQEQNDLMRMMAQDLNGKFTEKIEAIAGRAMQPVLQTMEDYMSVNTKEQIRFLDAVSARFVERLNATLDGQLKMLTQSIARSMAAQEEAMKALSDGMDSARGTVRDMEALRDTTDALKVSLNDYIHSFGEAQRKTDENYNRLASTVEQMDVIARQQNAYLKNVSAMNGEVTRAVENMTSAVSALYERMVDENENAVQTMARAGEDLKSMAGEVEKLQKQSLRVVEAEINSTMREYKACADQFTQSMQTLVNSMNDALGDLPKTVRETSDGFLDEVERLGATLADAQRLLDDTVDKMYNAPEQKA